MALKTSIIRRLDSGANPDTSTINGGEFRIDSRLKVETAPGKTAPLVPTKPNANDNVDRGQDLRLAA